MFTTHGPCKEKHWSLGVWFRLVTRFGEASVGTPKRGRASVNDERTGEHDRWRLDDVLTFKGTTQRPDPGREGD